MRHQAYPQGLLPLQVACTIGHYAAAQLLLKGGADISVLCKNVLGEFDRAHCAQIYQSCVMVEWRQWQQDAAT